MYLPRNLISHLYQHLLRTHHALSPPVLILVSLEPDALCACRILTALLKRDYIPHKIQPISGYGDLTGAGEALVQPMKTQHGGSGGLVVCLGVGGLVDLAAVLGLQSEDEDEDPSGRVEVWLIDARRPWNLGNVFGGNPVENTEAELDSLRGVNRGRLQKSYMPGQGGIIVYDDGDIDEDLSKEREAYCELVKMPDIEDDGDDEDSSGAESEPIGSKNGSPLNKKRKSWSDRETDADGSGDDGDRPRQRRRGSAVRASLNIHTFYVLKGVNRVIRIRSP
jgi:cell division control protein 45